jgi:Ni/Fe-hydrogenase subunit HybB-like protein
MNSTNSRSLSLSDWVTEKLFDGTPFRQWVKGQWTVFNGVAAFLVLLGVPFLVMRYMQGLGKVTHASNDQPWGLFLSWGLFSGVPLASTGFLMASAVFLFGLRHYTPLLRSAILTGFIGYLFAVVFLLVDLGIPWRLPYPLVRSFGTASVMFLVAWHVALYLSTQFVEFCPAVFEWLGADRWRRWALKVSVGATIFGVVLSTLHQSALGALFLLAPGKLHPLWYSSFLPLYFFVSSIFAGLSMVILESALIRRYLPDRMDAEHRERLDGLTLGLGQGAAVVLFVYFALKLIGVAHGHHWQLLGTSYGTWFLIEMFGFVLLPCFMFVYGVRRSNATLVRITALLSVLGVIANRFTVSMFAFNWQLPHREFFHGREVIIVVAIVSIEVVIYRWIINRMPVHRKHPDYRDWH